MVLDVEAADWRRERNSSDGTIKVALRTFHVCEAGGRQFGPCGTLITATRRPTDPDGMTAAIVRGDRWYCVCCGARVKASYGALNEIWHNGLVYWMRSNSPMMEDTSPGSDLAVLIDQVQPHIGEDDVIRLPEAGEIGSGPECDVYMLVDKKAFADMRVWKWSDVINFMEHF